MGVKISNETERQYTLPAIDPKGQAIHINPVSTVEIDKAHYDKLMKNEMVKAYFALGYLTKVSE